MSVSLGSVAANFRAAVRAFAASPKSFGYAPLFDYLRAQTRIVLHGRFGVSLPAHIRIAGSQVECPNYGAAFGLQKEIFLGESYRLDNPSLPPVIIDAGANIGMASVYFARRFPGARITAFEPDPAAYRALAQNMSGFHAECVQAAVGGRDGELVP